MEVFCLGRLLGSPQPVPGHSPATFLPQGMHLGSWKGLPGLGQRGGGPQREGKGGQDKESTVPVENQLFLDFVKTRSVKNRFLESKHKEVFWWLITSCSGCKI